MSGLLLPARAVRPPAAALCRSAPARTGRRGLAAAARQTPAPPPGPAGDYDVAVVGGGPAGLSLLAALQHSETTAGLRMALIEASELRQFEPERLASKDSAPFSNRCISLTPTSARFLHKIGVWDRLDHSRIQPYDRLHAWDGISGSKVSFEYPDSAPAPPPSGRPIPPSSSMAYMIENLNLTSTITQILRESGKVDIFSPALVKSIGPDPSAPPPTPGTSAWPTVELSTGERLSARLLVGADGANSPVRAYAGIDANGWDYDQHGVVATLTTDHAPAHPRAGYQRFLPTGTVAMLPLPGNKATLVWSTRPDVAAYLKRLPEREFCVLVNAAFRLSFVDLDYLTRLPPADVADEASWRLDRAHPEPFHPPRVVDVQPATVASFPLRMRQSDKFVAERVALLGDAAHVMHPLAGQGLNQGQADAEALAGAIERGLRDGLDYGFLGSRQLGLGGSPLSQYEKERFTANLGFGGFTDKMNKLFRPASGPVVWARSAGLSVVDALPGLKNWFMDRAVGKSMF